MRPEMARKRIRRQSNIQEEAFAQSIEGGRRHIASGALPLQKADASNDVLLIECKQTKHASYVLTLADLRRLEQQARKVGKVPVFAVRFTRKEEDYVVLRQKDFLDWLNEEEVNISV